MEAAEGRLLCVGSDHWAYLIVETQDMCSVESYSVGHVLCSEPIQWKPQRGAAEGRPLCGGGRRPHPLRHLTYVIVETQDMCLVESQDICRVETQDM